MFTLVITHWQQEERLAGAHPGAYLEAGVPLAAGDRVIFCRAESLDPAGYFASAHIRAIAVRSAGFLTVEFTPLTMFRIVVPPSSAELLTARLRKITLGDFTEIIRLGGQWEIDKADALETGFGFAEEEPAPFIAEPPEGDVADEAILDAYDWQCAFTGRPVQRHDLLDVRPLARGGRRSRRNSLPAIASVRNHVANGDVTIGAAGEFWVKKDRIDPELEEVLNPLGRLLGAGPVASAVAWAWHRRHVFASS